VYEVWTNPPFWTIILRTNQNFPSDCLYVSFLPLAKQKPVPAAAGVRSRNPSPSLYQPAPGAARGDLSVFLLRVQASFPRPEEKPLAVWERTLLGFEVPLRRWGWGDVPRRCWLQRRRCCGCLRPRQQEMPMPAASSVRKLEIFFFKNLMRMQF